MKEKRKVMESMVWIALLCMFVGVLTLTWKQGAYAQEKKFPTRPVTVIVPYKPGGGTEVETRNLSLHIEKYLGQPIIIKTIPGGGTTLGTSEAAGAKPDGYTIIATNAPDTIFSQEMLGADYQLENFEWIYGWFKGYLDVSVRADSPYKSLSDLIKASQKKPLKASNVGTGGQTQLMVIFLEKYTGLKAIPIPYPGGAPAMMALIRGDTDFFTCLSTTSVRFVRSKKIREVAMLGPKPLDAIPDTPTIYQLGYKDFPEIPFVRGVAAPPGTPPDKVKVLKAAFKKAVDDPGFRNLMKKQGRPVTPFSGEELSKFARYSIKLAKEYVPLMKKKK